MKGEFPSLLPIIVTTVSEIRIKFIVGRIWKKKKKELEKKCLK